MSALTAFGIERDGRAVVDMIETETGARIDAAADLDTPELRHVSRLACEMAVNAEKRAVSRDRDLPAVGSFGG